MLTIELIGTKALGLVPAKTRRRGDMDNNGGMWWDDKIN